MMAAKREMRLHRTLSRPLPPAAELAAIDRSLAEPDQVAETLKSSLADAVARLPQGGAITVEITDHRIRIKREFDTVFVALDALAQLLPTTPSVKRIERVCEKTGCRVVQLGKTPVVAIEEFNRKLLTAAEQ